MIEVRMMGPKAEIDAAEKHLARVYRIPRKVGPLDARRGAPGDERWVFYIEPLLTAGPARRTRPGGRQAGQ
jgi:hypothetical protein